MLSEDSKVEEAEIEVALWKTESINRKDKLRNRLQVIWIYCPKTQTGLTPFSYIHLLSNGLCSFYEFCLLCYYSYPDPSRHCFDSLFILSPFVLGFFIQILPATTNRQIECRWQEDNK
jgi:hypothetical protein